MFYWRIGCPVKKITEHNRKEELHVGKFQAYNNQIDYLPRFPLHPVSYTHLDVYKRQVLNMCCFYLLISRLYLKLVFAGDRILIKPTLLHEI